jgi:hypothetical protein
MNANFLLPNIFSTPPPPPPNQNHNFYNPSEEDHSKM